MNKSIKKMGEIVSALNNRKEEWSFLTSIEYMLNSKLYISSLCDDAKKVCDCAPAKKCKILDFGTGSGVFAVALRNFNAEAEIAAVDTYHNKSQKDSRFDDAHIQQDAIYDEFKKVFNIDFAHYDGLKLPFEDATFDIITSYAVVEHIEPENLEAILKEVRRVLKPGGSFWVFKLPRKLAPHEFFAGLFGMGKHDILFGDRKAKNLFIKKYFEVAEGWKSNMVFEFPGKITNKIYYVLKAIDYVLSVSPLIIFAHHNNFPLRKPR